MTPVHRFFFALRPPARQRALMGNHRDAIADAHGHVGNERLHITIGITDDYERYPAEIEQAMLEIGAEAAADPFAVSLDRLSGGVNSVALRPSRRIRGLLALQEQLDRGMTRRRLRRRDWSFSPHATLVYRKGRPFQQRVTPIEWQAMDFVLIHSIVGATRHIELGRWPLEARQFSFGW